MSSQPRKSIGNRSLGARSEGGRTVSVGSEDTEKSGVKQREGMMVPTLRVEPEQEGDDDVANGE